MQSVTGTSLTALHSSISQFELRPVQHGPKNLRHEHDHDHRERTHRHGRRAAQVFRQEVLYRLEERYQSILQSSFSNANPYHSGDSADEVAAEVINAARAIVEQSD